MSLLRSALQQREEGRTVRETSNSNQSRMVGLSVGSAALACWLLSRALMALLWTSQEAFNSFDVRYYYWQLIHYGPDGALIEYPTPIPLLLEAIRVVGGPTEDAYLLAFGLTMGLVDAAASVWLWRSCSRLAAIYWSVFTFAIGPLIWFRIDLLPAVAVLAGLVWVTRRPAAAGAAVALGAATKLWPAMLIVPMLGTGRRARRRALGFTVVGGLLGLGSLLWFGWDRSISPLTWQSDRGLQIESIVATVPMIRHAFEQPDRYRTELSHYNAWEVYGPGTDMWLAVADWLMVGCVLLALVLGWLIALGGAGMGGRKLTRATDDDPHEIARRSHAIVLAQLALICAVIVANKTFSPQYMIWLSGPLAVLISLPLPRADRLAGRLLASLGLACAVLTHLVYPLNYAGLISTPSLPLNTLLLAGRNLLMLIFAAASIGLALRAAWRLGHPQINPPAADV